MKKMIKLGLVSLLTIMVASCSSNDTCDKPFRKDCKREFRKECRMKKPCNKQFEKWVKFDSLSEDEQKALIKETKKAIDNREAKRKAYRDSIEALWNDFDNLSLEQQKDLLMKKMHGFHKPHKFHEPHKGMRCKKDFKKCPKGQKPECPRADAPAK